MYRIDIQNNNNKGNMMTKKKREEEEEKKKKNIHTVLDQALIFITDVQQAIFFSSLVT